MKQKLLILLPILLAGAAAIAILTTQASASGGSPEAPTASRVLGLFRGQEAHERLTSRTGNARVMAAVQHTATRNRTLRLDAAAAETVSGPQGEDITVTPGVTGACVTATLPAASSLVGAGEGTICQTYGNIGQEGLVMTLKGVNGDFYLWGLVPNGNQTVSLSTGPGKAAEMPVVDNTFEAVGADRFISATFNQTGGSSVTTPLF